MSEFPIIDWTSVSYSIIFYTVGSFVG